MDGRTSLHRAAAKRRPLPALSPRRLGFGHDLAAPALGHQRGVRDLAACIKGGLELQGYAVGTPLAPQPALPPEGIEAVRAALIGLGAL